MRIAVVGGSLGGLTAACLLRDAGHDVEVFERSSRELEQRGAGIGLLEATYRYLVERAGVALPDVSIATDHIRYLHRDGSILHDAAHPYLFSSWNTVYRRLLDEWRPSPYHLDHEMTGFDQDERTVRIRFADGSETVADVLVCADGVGSLARAVLVPDADEGYAGYVAWRGMVPERELEPAVTDRLTDAITYYVYANSHVLVYPIPGLDGSVAAGDRLLNFVWYRNYLEGDDLDDVMTARTGERHVLSMPPGAVAPRHDAEVRAEATARLPEVIATVVEATRDLFLQVVYDIKVDRMAFGRICLVGDAAFAVRPHAAAGTAKAADDAWALTAALETAPDVASALAEWEARQLVVGRRLLERTRRIGRRSQVDNDWVPGDPDLVFGLHGPGN